MAATCIMYPWRRKKKPASDLEDEPSSEKESQQGCNHPLAGSTCPKCHLHAILPEQPANGSEDGLEVSSKVDSLTDSDTLRHFSSATTPWQSPFQSTQFPTTEPSTSGVGGQKPGVNPGQEPYSLRRLSSSSRSSQRFSPQVYVEDGLKSETSEEWGLRSAVASKTNPERRSRLAGGKTVRWHKSAEKLPGPDQHSGRKHSKGLLRAFLKASRSQREPASRAWGQETSHLPNYSSISPPDTPQRCISFSRGVIPATAVERDFSSGRSALPLVTQSLSRNSAATEVCCGASDGEEPGVCMLECVSEGEGRGRRACQREVERSRTDSCPAAVASQWSHKDWQLLAKAARAGLGLSGTRGLQEGDRDEVKKLLGQLLDEDSARGGHATPRKAEAPSGHLAEFSKSQPEQGTRGMIEVGTGEKPLEGGAGGKEVSPAQTPSKSRLSYSGLHVEIPGAEGVVHSISKRTEEGRAGSAAQHAHEGERSSTSAFSAAPLSAKECSLESPALLSNTKHCGASEIFPGGRAQGGVPGEKQQKAGEGVGGTPRKFTKIRRSISATTSNDVAAFVGRMQARGVPGGLALAPAMMAGSASTELPLNAAAVLEALQERERRLTTRSISRTSCESFESAQSTVLSPAADSPPPVSLATQSFQQRGPTPVAGATEEGNTPEKPTKSTGAEPAFAGQRHSLAPTPSLEKSLLGPLACPHLRSLAARSAEADLRRPEALALPLAAVSSEARTRDPGMEGAVESGALEESTPVHSSAGGWEGGPRREGGPEMQLLLMETAVQAHELLLQDESLNGTDVAAFLLGKLLELTSSEMGFVTSLGCGADGSQYLKTHAITNIGWTPELRQWYEENEQSGMVFQNMDTLFGAVVTTCDVVLTNHVASDTRASGVPPGHPTIHSFLGVPLLAGSELVGMFSVANSAEPYSHALVEDLRPLTRATAHIVSELRRRALDDLEVETVASDGGQSSMWWPTPGHSVLSIEDGDNLSIGDCTPTPDSQCLQRKVSGSFQVPI